MTNSDRPISVMADGGGSSDTSHFSRTFKAHYGSSPTDYRNAFRLDASIVTHRYQDLSRGFKLLTDRMNRLESQLFRAGHAQDYGGIP